VGTVTGRRAGRALVPFLIGEKVSLFFRTFRLIMGPTYPSTQWLPGTLTSISKWPGREVDHLAPYSVKVKNEGSYTSTSWCAQEIFCLCNYKHVAKELSEYWK